MNGLRHMLILTAKDLRIEARNRHTIALLVVLSVLVVVVLALGLGPGLTARSGTTSILLLACLVGGVLCFEKTMNVERHDEALAGLLLTPVARGTIFGAKLLANLVLMLVLAAIVTPIGMLLFDFDLTGAPVMFGAIMGLSMVGFAAVGTLFSAAASSSRLQGGLLATMVFPMVLPLVLAATQSMRSVFEHTEVAGRGIGVLVAFDLIFLAAGWLAFELVLEP